MSMLFMVPSVLSGKIFVILVVQELYMSDIAVRLRPCLNFEDKTYMMHDMLSYIPYSQITKMIEDAVTDRDKCFVKGAIPLERLTLWMTENELLSVILSGSIDQAQYCEKVKRIVEHVGPHLSREDLEKLWNRTVSSCVKSISIKLCLDDMCALKDSH